MQPTYINVDANNNSNEPFSSEMTCSHLQNLTNGELTAKIKSLATQERHLTEQILWHIAEVDRRQLFLRLAYSSLFDYLTREIGYTPGSAQRRIDAARLLQKLPEVADKIKSGNINLGQISKLQQAQRQHKKETGQTVDLEVQKILLVKIEKQSVEKTEQILAQYFDLKLEVAEKKRTQKDESVRIELTFSKSEMALLRRAQEILSNKTGGALKGTIIAMAEKVVKSRVVKVKLSENKNPMKLIEAKCQAKRSETKSEVGSGKGKSEVRSCETKSEAELCEMKSETRGCITESEGGTSVAKGQARPVTEARVTRPTVTATVAVNKTLTPKTKKTILARDESCQFKSPVTGDTCGNKFHLEIDHIQPRYAQGSHALDNLRVLCRQHNQYRYRESL